MRSDSPFLQDCYFGSGFVSDDDRVSLQSLLFASPMSRGALHVALQGGVPVAPHALSRTLSTPRSSVDTNQVKGPLGRQGPPRGGFPSLA